MLRCTYVLLAVLAYSPFGSQSLCAAGDEVCAWDQSDKNVMLQVTKSVAAAQSHTVVHIVEQDTMVSPFDSFMMQAAAETGIGEFSLLLGDEEGIRFAIQSSGGSGFQPSNVTNPIRVGSAGKWVVAAALGAAIKQGMFAWDDPVSKYIKWWTTDPNDNRSRITFKHCLSHTSGLAAMEFAYAGHSMVETSKLEDFVHASYSKTGSDISVPSSFHDIETNYLVAEYAALQATGFDSWQRFFFRYWAEPLGLHMSVLAHDRASLHKYFDASDAYGYGFYHSGVEHERFHSQAHNPDGGSQLILSPCAYAQFMISYLDNGDDKYDANTLDEIYPSDEANVGGRFGNYALGHWVFSTVQPVLWHSVGTYGALPVIASIPSRRGKKFWLYLNRFSETPQAPVTSLMFLKAILPKVTDFMTNPPPLDGSSCPTPFAGGWHKHSRQQLGTVHYAIPMPVKWVLFGAFLLVYLTLVFYRCYSNWPFS